MNNHKHIQHARSTWLQACHEAGISLKDMLVLSVIDDVCQEHSSALGVDVGTIAVPRSEIAARCGLSIHAVKAAVARLCLTGCIARRQMVKARGCPSDTLLLPRGRALLGADDGLLCDVPPSLAACLFAEAPDLVRAVCAAYHAGDMVAASVGSSYCGGSAAWERVEAILRARTDRVLGELTRAAEHVHDVREAQARGDMVFDLADGSTYTVDGALLEEVAPGPVDAAFVREVVETVVRRQRVTLTAEMASRLVAEAAYSRACGFLVAKGRSDAVRILASQMVLPRWSRPRQMGADWYGAARRAGRLEAGYAQAA